MHDVHELPPIGDAWPSLIAEGVPSIAAHAILTKSVTRKRSEGEGKGSRRKIVTSTGPETGKRLQIQPLPAVRFVMS